MAADPSRFVGSFWHNRAALLFLAWVTFLTGVVVVAFVDHRWGPRRVPTRFLPVPQDVSPQLQALMAVKPGHAWPAISADRDIWHHEAQRSGAALAARYPAMEQRLQVSVQPEQIGGVPCFVLTPAEIAPANRNRLLLHIHGGGYILYAGVSGIGEAIQMAGIGHIRVVSVDYRLAPDHPYPAAVDDAMAVWRAAQAMAKPGSMGVFGGSSGGGLVLSLIQRAIADHAPLPAAIAPATPWSDLSATGDSRATNAFVDNTLVAFSGFLKSAAAAYAGGLDLKDPRISPVYGDFHGFPPTILITGTRDLFLSDTVRVHRKLREAGVEADLQVFEGMSHAQYMMEDQVPEAREVFEEMARFFDRHLGRD